MNAFLTVHNKDGILLAIHVTRISNLKRKKKK